MGREGRAGDEGMKGDESGGIKAHECLFSFRFPFTQDTQDIIDSVSSLLTLFPFYFLPPT